MAERSTVMAPARDMGGDGNGLRQTIAKDVYGYALHYYGTADYKAIDATVKPFTDAANLRALYNGNIAGMSVNIPKAGVPQLYTYKYDQLNRLKDAQTYAGLNTSTDTCITTQNFRETFSYDGNGNILTALRNGNAAVSHQPMDNLAYGYNRDAGGRLINNCVM
jgi:hypothetical protein